MATLLKVNNSYNLPNIGISSGQAPPPTPAINISTPRGVVQASYTPPPAPTPQHPTWGRAPTNHPVIAQPLPFKFGSGVHNPILKFGAGLINSMANSPAQIGIGINDIGQGYYKQGLGQVGGGLLNSPITYLIGGGEAKAGLEGAKALSTGAKVLKGVKTGAKIGGVYGAGQGATSAMANNENAKNIAINTLLGGATGAISGAALGGATPVVGAGVSKLAEADQAIQRAFPITRNLNPGRLGLSTKDVSPERNIPPETVPNIPRSQQVEDAFNKSTGQQKLGTIGNANVEIGSFGKSQLTRKTASGRSDRLSVEQIKQSLPNIKASYNATDLPNTFRTNNIAHVAEMPNGEKRVIYTRRNSAGNEEVINAHKVNETKNPNYISTLESFGSPDRIRTGIAGIEARQSVPLTYGADRSIPKTGVNVNPVNKPNVPQIPAGYKGVEVKGGHALDNLKNPDTVNVDSGHFGNSIGFDARELQKQTTGKLRSDYWLKKINNGERPPVLVDAKNGKLKVVDGNHRISAYMQTGSKDVPTVFTKQAKELTAPSKPNVPEVPKGKIQITQKAIKGQLGNYSGTGADFEKGTGKIQVGDINDNPTVIHEVAHKMYEALPQEHQGALDYALSHFNEKNPGAHDTLEGPNENIALAAQDYLANKKAYGKAYTNELANNTPNGRLLVKFFKDVNDTAASKIHKVTQPTQGASSLQKGESASSGLQTSNVSSAAGAVSKSLQIPRLGSKPAKLSAPIPTESVGSSLTNTTTPLTNDEIKVGHALGLDKRQMASAKSQDALDKAFQTSMADIKAGSSKVSPEDLASLSSPEQMKVSNYLNSLTAPKRELPPSPVGVGELPQRSEIPLSKYILASKVNAIRSIGGKDANDLADRIVNTDRVARDLRSNWMNQSRTVMNLNKHEFEQAVDVKEGKLSPTAVSAKVQQAVAEMHKIFPDVHNQGFGEGLIIGDRGSTYFPHSYPDLKNLKGSKLDNALQYLMDTEQVDHKTATQLFNQAVNDGKYPNRFGNFANARLTDMPGYFKDKQAYTTYLQSAAQNIAEARNFGTDNEIATKLLDNIRINGGDNEAAQKALENYLRSADRGRLAKPLQAVRGTYGGITLGKAVISHAGQTSNTMVEAGIGRTLKGWGQFLSRNPEHKDFIAKTGVDNPQELHNYREQLTSFRGVMGKATAPFLNPMMRVNRSVTALAGRAYGDHLAEVGDEAKLRQLGVTGNIGKNLTESQQIEAARGLVDTTMFSGSRATTPILAETPAGKTIGQFRTAYAYKQTGFIYRQVIKEARNGNLAPLMRYLTVSAGIGFGTVALKNKISGNKEGPGGIAMDAAAALGGLPGEAASELIRYGIGHHNLTGAVAGELAPLAGEGLNALNAIDKGGKQAARYALKKIPYVGPRVAQKVVPPTPSSAKQQVLTGAKQPQTGIYQVKAKDGSTKYATLQSSRMTGFPSLAAAKTAQAKNEFKYSNKKITTINGQQYHKTPSGMVIKGAIPPPKLPSTSNTSYDPKTNTWTRVTPSTGKTVKIASNGTETVVSPGIGHLTNAKPEYVTNIVTLAKKYNVDPYAALSVAAMEGLSGGVGDNGTSFGPFQLHEGGALPAGKNQAWAESPAGIEYALQQISHVAGGLKGQAAINAIVQGFEKPANPSNEASGALAIYSGKNATLSGGNPGGVKLAGTSTKKVASIKTPKVKIPKTPKIKLARTPAIRVKLGPKYKKYTTKGYTTHQLAIKRPKTSKGFNLV